MEDETQTLPAEVIHATFTAAPASVEAHLQKDAEPVSYRPAAWYWRARLRACRRLNEAIGVGLRAMDEIDCLKAQVREMGAIPWRVYDVQSVFPDGSPSDNDTMEAH